MQLKGWMRRAPGFLFQATLLAAPLPAQRTGTREVPNAPATLTATDSTVSLRYGGTVIFEGRVAGTGGKSHLRVVVDSSGGRITQVISWTVHGGQFNLRGVVHATVDAFAADADPREDGLPIVRHSVGPSHNLLNRAVYARSHDWLLSVDFPARVQITPTAGDDSSAFLLEASGFEVTLRFRPRFYQKHRGLSNYEPWTYTPWKRSVAGWTSWFAFLDRVTEQDIHRAADVIADRLGPYRYEYLQIDDGYQRLPISTPDHWLNTNEKFPAGLSALRRYIGERGLSAGLWTNTTFHDSTWATGHPSYFVRDRDGAPAWGNWVGYVMDGSNPATMRDLVLPVYRQLKTQGWSYFKVDALRHLRYEGYNSNAGWFARRGLDRTRVYRTFVQEIRDAIGRDAFLLASWGPRPELIGVIDATRLGDDGFGYGSFAQFNSFNNVVWRNDPDHIEIHQADGYRAATLASLTGSLLMLTDRPEVYQTDRVEAARRTAPVLFTQPGQVYDLDPTRSSRLWMAEHEVSGSGPRPFEADQRLQQTLYQLDVARPFERWTVLARTPGAPDTMRASDLGLAAGRPYIAFDFWAHRLIGAFQDTLALPPIDSLGVQVVCIRERQDHPQLLSTNRHVSCGGVDLEQVTWTGAELSGHSQLAGRDTYTLYLTEPDGWACETITVDGAQVVGESRMAPVRTFSMSREQSGRASWSIHCGHR